MCARYLNLSRITIAFFLSFFITNQMLSQCPTSTIILNSQGDIDSLSTSYPNCTHFQGGLFISGNDITNLDALSHITSIGRNLEIENNPMLTDISGLSNLQSIERDLYLHNNPDLRSLDGLQFVSSLIDLTVSNLNSLADLNGLEGLTSVDRIFISENISLESLSGLSNLEIITQYFDISSNPFLETLSPLTDADLSNMYSIVLTNNPLLTGCDVARLCDYVALGNDDFISQNGQSCSSVEEINATCESVCNPGSPCDDGDDSTTDDVLGDDCLCMGTPPDSGTPCDDGDPNTENDVIQSDGFTCAGTPIGGPVDCDAILVSNGASSITITGLPTVNSEMQLLNEALEVVYYCIEDCQEETTIMNLPAGLYDLKINVYSTETIELICTLDFDVLIPCMTDVDMDGVCAEEDCNDNDASIPATPGTSCDDGDVNTILDLIQSDSCTCAGTVNNVQRTCNEVTVAIDYDDIIISGLDASSHTILEVFNHDWVSIFSCTGDCAPAESVVDLSNGRYFIRAKLFDADWNQVCELEEFVIIKNVTNLESPAPTVELSEAVINFNPQSASAIAARKQPYMTIYPNPVFSNNQFYIQLSNLDNAPTVVRIYDNLGRLVNQRKSQGVNEIKYNFNLAQYPVGMYMIRLDFNGVPLITKKLMVVKDK